MGNAFDIKHLSSRELTLVILKLAFAGALIASALVAPGLGIVYQHFKKHSIANENVFRKNYTTSKKADT